MGVVCHWGGGKGVRSRRIILPSIVGRERLIFGLYTYGRLLDWGDWGDWAGLRIASESRYERGYCQQ